MCFYEKSKMAATRMAHVGSQPRKFYKKFLPIETLNLVTRKVKMVLNILTMALAPKKMMKVAKKPKVSRKMTAEVIVETVKVRRKMQHLIEAKEEEGVVVVEEEAVVVQQGVVVVQQEALVVLDNHVANKLFNKRILKHSGFQWTESQMFLLSLALLG